MVDSNDDIMHWDEEEEDDEFYDHESASNNYIYSHQGGEGVNNSSLPLGLRLNPTPSFINLLQKAAVSNKKSRTKTDAHLRPQHSVSEKVKAGNFPAASIKIGNWQRISRYEGDLTAKLYYAKHKLVWEMLDGALKCKIEMQWSDICAIRATMHENQPGILEIELSQAPLYFREVNPQPRKHTLWRQSSDFTGGEAAVWRRHIVSFKPGILNKHYEQLLQSNKRLFEMSHKPFPRHESPYFDPNLYGNSGMSLNFNRAYQELQYPYQSHPAPEPPLTIPSYPSLPVIYENQQQPQTVWDEGPSYKSQIYDQDPQYLQEYYQPPNVGLMSDIDNNMHHLHSTNPPLMGSLPDPMDVIDPSFNYSCTGYQYPYAADQTVQDASSSTHVTDDFYSQQHANWNVPPQHSCDVNVVNYQESSSLPPYYYSGLYNPSGHDNLF